MAAIAARLPLGPSPDRPAHAAVYTAAAIVHYLVCMLAVGTGLAALGVDHRLARVAGACGEIGFMYTALRWVVFRDVQRPDDPGPPAG
jgi:hypothetical protein